MRRERSVIALLIGVMLSACETPPLFPRHVTDGVDGSFDFAEWRNAPSTKLDHKVQLGGRILEAITAEGETVMVVHQLPIVMSPAYGPKDTGKRTGEFAVSYAGKLPDNALAKGYQLIVVGITQKMRVVESEAGRRSLPVIMASCIHVWKTGMRDDIADFSSVGAGYETLEENTYCISEH